MAAELLRERLLSHDRHPLPAFFVIADPLRTIILDSNINVCCITEFTGDACINAGNASTCVSASALYILPHNSVNIHVCLSFLMTTSVLIRFLLQLLHLQPVSVNWSVLGCLLPHKQLVTISDLGVQFFAASLCTLPSRYPYLGKYHIACVGGDINNEAPKCLNAVGIIFTYAITYTGFALLAIGTLWNANIVKKLREIRSQWRALRASRPTRP
jgi:hypothetical protein